MIDLYAREEVRIRVWREARTWERAGIISEDQLAAVRGRYEPELVQVSVFLRLLLALFTAVAVLSVPLLAGFLFEPEELGIAFLLLAISPALVWLADRQLIARRTLYRCGAEEAMIYCAIGLTALGLGLLTSDLGRPWESGGWLLAHSVMIAGSCAVAIRYGYPIAALAGLIALGWLPVHLYGGMGWKWLGSPRIGVFVLAGCAALLSQWFLEKGRDSLKYTPPSYSRCLEVVRFGALALLYLDVNYYVHRLGLWGDLLGIVVRSGAPSAASNALCALLTGALPGAALVWGVLRRDRALLWFGALAGVASILTLKYFFHLGYLAEEITAAGLVLTGTAFGLLRWLRAGPRRQRGGLTGESLLEPELYGLDAEALAAIQPFVPAASPEQGGFRPGGGTFGGGGATQGY